MSRQIKIYNNYTKITVNENNGKRIYYIHNKKNIIFCDGLILGSNEFGLLGFREGERIFKFEELYLDGLEV